jgi:phage tail tape measure protein, TP901 family
MADSGNVMAMEVKVDGIDEAISKFSSLAKSFGELSQAAETGSASNEKLGESLSKAADSANSSGEKVKKLGDDAQKTATDTEKLSSSSKKASADVKKLGDEAGKSGEQIKKVKPAAEGTGNSLMKAFGGKVASLISAIGGKLKFLIEPLKKIGSLGKKAFSFLTGSLGGSIGNFATKLKNIAKASAEAGASGGGVGALGSALKGIAGLATGPVGATVVAIGALTAATAGFAVKAVQASGNFQKGMNMVYTMLPNASQQTKDKLSKDVLDLSQKYGQAADNISASMYQALSAGVAANDVKGFLDVAQQATIASGLNDTAIAVDGISSVVNAFGAKNISAKKASDLMFTAVRKGKTTFGEMASSIAQVSPVASSLGVQFSDLTAVVATMTAKGTPTSETMTQMKAAFSEFSKGSSKASKEFKAATGKSFKDFIAQGGNLQTAMQALDQHAQKSGKNINEFFGSVEAGSFALSVTGKNAKDFAENMKEMQNSDGATEQAYKQMDQGIGPSINRMKASMAKGMIEAGQAITPMATQIVQSFEGALPAIGSAFSSIGQSFLPLISGWASAISGFFQSIQSNASQFSSIFQAVGSVLTVIFSSIGAAISILGSIFSAVFSVIGSLLSSFASAAGLAGSQGQSFASTISGAFSTIASVVGGALQFIMPLLTGLAQIIGGVLGFAVKGIINTFLFFGKIISKVGGFFKKLFGKDDAQKATESINEVKKGMEELNAEAAKPAQKQVDINAQVNTQIAQAGTNAQPAGMSFQQVQQSPVPAQPQTVKLDPTAKVSVDPGSLANTQMKIDPSAFNEMQMKVDPSSFANTQMKIDPAAFNNLQQAVKQVSADIKGNPLDTTRNSILGEIKGQINALKGEISATKSAIVGKLGEVVGAVRAIKINVNVPAAPSGDAIANKIAASLQKG